MFFEFKFHSAHVDAGLFSDKMQLIWEYVPPKRNTPHSKLLRILDAVVNVESTKMWREKSICTEIKALVQNYAGIRVHKNFEILLQHCIHIFYPCPRRNNKARKPQKPHNPIKYHCIFASYDTHTQKVHNHFGIIFCSIKNDVVNKSDSQNGNGTACLRSQSLKQHIHIIYVIDMTIKCYHYTIERTKKCNVWFTYILIHHSPQTI